MPAFRLGARALIVMLLLAACPIASAQVHRCAAPDGTTIFTDRACADLGAVDSVPRGTVGTGARLYRSGCSHTLQDLVFELTAAIDARDVNRMAGIYHWVGLSGATAYTVMDRLQVIVQRPLVDISPLFPSGPGGEQGDYYPQATTRRAPTGLRLEQTLANGSTPAHTVLGLRRYLGCWWISL
ncbi:hypothetical protein [Cognatiluteimonas profundi]|uniref:hypothetical protein n=1 Tax=Cognatiluteimonas profundi TaxID=2594501 RepID=UPI00131ADC40|nr:hypothetical protein [Lysobacter profundi]